MQKQVEVIDKQTKQIDDLIMMVEKQKSETKKDK